jgi:DNA polymerase-1
MEITNQPIVSGLHTKSKLETGGRLQSVATFDCESDGLLDDATVVHCIVIKDHSDGQKYSYGPRHITDALVHLSSFDTLIGHNSIAYDFALLRKLHGWEFLGEKIDTLLMSRMQRPNRVLPPMCRNKTAGPHSVEAWAYRVGEDRKIEHEDWSKFSPEMLARCERDCELQFKIYLALLEEGAGEGWERAHKLNHKLFHHLQRQEEYGWLVDRDWFDYCCRVLDRYIAKIDYVVSGSLPLVTEIEETKKDGEYNYVRKPFRKDGSYSEVVSKFFSNEGVSGVSGPFSRISFRPVDLNSNQETKDFLLAQGWEPVEWNTNNAGQRTSPKLSKTDPFEGVEGRLGQLIARRVQCRHRKSQIEGWLLSIRSDGRIAARVGGVATTGRLKHAVVVNVPNTDSFFGHHMRKGFICRPGWKLVGCDSKGNQMRQLAALMNDPEFTHAVLNGTKENGDDLHSLNQKRSGVATRTLAKNFFYGCILFGAGDRKTAKILNSTVDEAKRKKQDYFNEMPKLRCLLDTEIEKWRKTANKYWNKRYNRWEYSNGYINGLDGRPILVEFEKDILVYHLQSMEAIHMSAAYCWMHKLLEQAGYKYKEDWGVCVYMHDEVVAECRPEIAEHVAQLMSQAIKKAGEFYKINVPHEGDAKIGNNWKETH